MNLTAEQRRALAEQGLEVMMDFADFGRDELEQALKNMRTSIPGIPETPAVVDANGTVTTPAIPAVDPVLPVILPAKSIHRLTVASIAWEYYTNTSRVVTHTNMHYTNVLKSFYTEWKAIISMSEETPADVPCITKNNPPLKWTDTFKDWSMNTFGVRNAPLAYVIRDNVDVLPEVRPANDTTTKIDPLLDSKPHGASGSVLGDLVSRLSHTHPLYKTDNAKVYTALEEATRSTTYSSTVKAFSRSRDGRGAWFAVISNHAGNDKWELLQKENTKWLMNTKWTGRNYSLEKFCNQHRSRFVNLQEAASHVDFQLPTAHTRVGYLIDNIENPDADLRAAIANIRQDVNNTRSDFENAVAVLLPVDPFKKSRRGNHNNTHNTSANISSASVSSVNKPNDGIGKSGVVFHFYDGADYAKLTPEQKKELHEWRSSARGKTFSSDEKKKRKAASLKKHPHSAAIKSAVKAALNRERKRQKKESDDIDEMAELIAQANLTQSSDTSQSTGAVSAVTEAHKQAASKLIEKRNSIKKRMTSE